MNLNPSTSILSESAREALFRQSADAQGLPGAAYNDAGFYELERRNLFARSWVAAAVGAELPGPGCVLPRTVAGWPLVFVRDNKGQVRCFHNICRHRGAAIVTETCSKVHALRCPWHGWMYDLEGKLKGTPEFAGPNAHNVEGFDAQAAGLVPVTIGQWFDFIFVNIDGQAEPLETFLSPLRQRYRAFADFENFHYAHSWHHVYESNWKISVESGIEDYHLSWLHPQITLGNKRADKSVSETDGDCFFAVRSESAHLAAGRTKTGVEPLPRAEGIPSPDNCSNSFLNIFPTGVLGIAMDGVYAGIWLPDGPAKTQLHFHFYFVGEEGARSPQYEASRQSWIDTISGVFRQDTDVVRGVQERTVMRDELGISTRFSPYWESCVKRFQQLVFERMTADR